MAVASVFLCGSAEGTVVTFCIGHIQRKAVVEFGFLLIHSHFQSDLKNKVPSYSRESLPAVVVIKQRLV